MPLPRRALLLAGTAFLLSGTSALVYQVAWQRVLALHTGVGIYSIAMIVAAFMAGLGAGSHLGGVLSTPLGAGRALRAFAWLELGIALFGAASVPLYYDLLYGRGAALYDSALLAGLLHFLALLLPTGLMGMSLPFLSRGLVRDAATAGRTVGLLYAVNTLGAALGAMLAPWVLIRHLGMQGAVLVAAASNLVAAGCAVWLARAAAVAPAPEAPPAGAPPAATGVEAPGRSFPLWMSLYALSGFCALSLEILWFRIIDVAVKSSAFTFGTVLAIFLLGFGGGALAGSFLVERIARPLLVFVRLQCAILIWAALGALVLVATPPEWPLYEWFSGYWRGHEGFRLGVEDDPGALLRLYVLLPLFLYGVPTLLMGLSFPVLQRAVHDDPETSGRKVGFLQAANIAGCTAGSLLVGLVLLSAFGTTGTLRLLVLCGLAFAAVGVRWYGPRRDLLALAAALVVLAAALPGQRAFWLRLHGLEEGPSLLEEDATSVVTIAPTDRVWFLFVNGKSNSALPYGGGEHTLLGALPAVIHPAPEEVAIVGLGSGNTAWAAGCRRETRSVRVFEIAGPQLRLLRALDGREDLPRLRQFLEDPRVRVDVADGRNALEREDVLYDVIEADALRPWTGYSGNLYSEEFFRRCARRLKPGGLMCTWAPTPRVYETFARVFPQAIEVGAILVGGPDPLPLDVEGWTERARSPEVVEYLGAHAARQLQRSLAGARRVAAPVRPTRNLNRDLFPRDEFSTP
jgi:spermidine synthase